MPRPGPRPYECVRRAWHSDRHQPIRGSLIQEIFRVVNEVHNSATKKNKEWQEKLPVVVLKAEEIMYSKANSEAEYVDLKTLRDRTDDAINTIIRRDESTETGDLLQPCIEAALNLGCTPRRTSRSQRNCHPRCYLSIGNQESNTSSPSIAYNIIQANSTTSPQSIPDFSNIMKPAVANSTHSELQNPFCHNMSVTSNKFLFPTDNACLSNCNQCLPMENCPMSSLWSVFPLYYGTCLESQHSLGTIPKSVPSAVKPVNVGMAQSLFSCNNAAAFEINQTESKDCLIDQHDIGCDLSLRLGSLLAPLPSLHNRQLEYAEDVSYGCSEEGSKFNEHMPQKDKEFSFFTTVNRENPLGSTKLSEQATVGALVKKRKAVLGHFMDNQAYWQPKLPCNNLTGRMKSTGT